MTVAIQGLDPLAQRFEAMIDRCARAGDLMMTEFIAWQTEDMRRRYPSVDRPAQNTVSTQVFPRSRMVKRPEPRHKSGVARARRLRGGGRQLAHSTRPILRPELFDKLCARMTATIKGLFA